MIIRICVKKISNVPISQRHKKEANVEVEIALYAGGKLLTEPVKTSVTTLKEETTWNETLTCYLNIHTIPKVTDHQYNHIYTMNVL